MVSMQRFQSVLGKPYLPPLFFFSGVTYDTVTLTRIDRLQDNLLLLLYLVMLGFLIVLTGRLGTHEATVEDLPPDAPSSHEMGHPSQALCADGHSVFAGGLFSAYTIFYSKSATLTGTAVFFCLLVGFLVANEFLRDRLSNIQLLVGLYALGVFRVLHIFPPCHDRFNERNGLSGWSRPHDPGRVARGAPDLLAEFGPYQS